MHGQPYVIKSRHMVVCQKVDAHNHHECINVYTL